MGPTWGLPVSCPQVGPMWAPWTCYLGFFHTLSHYDEVIMTTMASQITSLTVVYSVVYSDQRKHQSSASLAFVRGIHREPVNSPHKWPVTRKMFPFDDVIMPAGDRGSPHRFSFFKMNFLFTFFFVCFLANAFYIKLMMQIYNICFTHVEYTVIKNMHHEWKSNQINIATKYIDL